MIANEKLRVSQRIGQLGTRKVAVLADPIRLLILPKVASINRSYIYLSTSGHVLRRPSICPFSAVLARRCALSQHGNGTTPTRPVGNFSILPCTAFTVGMYVVDKEERTHSARWQRKEAHML